MFLKFSKKKSVLTLSAPCALSKGPLSSDITFSSLDVPQMWNRWHDERDMVERYNP